MKSRNTILIFGGLALALVLGIFVWQISALPNLRLQIRSGLHNSLQTIADDAANSLDDAYTNAVLRGSQKLKQTISPDAFRVENLLQLRSTIFRIASTELISNSWIAVFPTLDRSSFRAYEFKPPSRYRSDLSKDGNWRTDTDLSLTIERELQVLMQNYPTVDSFGIDYWRTSVDSNLVFGFDMAFNDAVLIGTPWFHPETDSLLGFLFSQTDSWYLERVFVRDFINQSFWQGIDEREGIKRKYLQMGVLDARGSRVVYNSVAYGDRKFEHVSSLANLGSWLPDYRVGVGLRDSTVEEVADSIYNRNFYLIIALFVFLILVLTLLYRAAVQMVRLSRLKTEFVANVSHEIKTPLASIKLATDTLKLGRAKTPEQSGKIVNIIDKETERLQYLIHTLLDFSQLESGRKKYKKEQVDTAEWWTRVEAFFRDKVGEGLEVEVRGEPKGQLLLDTRALEQVFTILIDNAKKYAPDSERVILSAQAGKRGFRIALQDFGIGIHRENQEIIFDKFVRLGNTDVHNVKGYGIGLSMAQAIIKDHGGKIGVESKLGEGSTFYIEIPHINELEP